MNYKDLGNDFCLAIHDYHDGFSERWIAYCQEHEIHHQKVNAHDSDIIAQLKGCDGFLWHFSVNNPTDLMVARHILKAIEQIGIPVFPNTETCWHFDDKVAQKYLLEAIDAPLVPTYVFYDEDKALAWLSQTGYPVVCKLRAGAGSRNVKLLKDYRSAVQYCRAIFGKGISPVPGHFADAKTRLRNTKNFEDFLGKLRRLPKNLQRKNWVRRRSNPEKGYALFQEFIPNNLSDTRITVVGNRAWGYIRNVRKGDFRASGSGSINYDTGDINLECVKIAFRIAKVLGAQSIAFDFVIDQEGKPLLVEISYGYVAHLIHAVKGQWSEDLSWQEGHMWPQDAIIEDFLNEIAARKQNVSVT